MTGILFHVERSSYVDGPGIRTTVFFKGCNLHCAWCHNPEGRLPEPQMLFYRGRCTGCGRCKEKCPQDLKRCDLCGKCTLYCPRDARELCGRRYTVAEVLGEIKKDKAFYEASGGGVTFSGGECMLQIDFLEELLRECKSNGIHTAVDTAGQVPYERFERILPHTDLILYDVKCIDREKHRKYTGVGNELILENLARLLSSGQRVWVRIPVIPSVNDSEGEMAGIRRFFDIHGRPERIELLPYHAMGEHKYEALGITPAKFNVPPEETVKALRALF